MEEDSNQEDSFWNELKDDWTGRTFRSDFKNGSFIHVIIVKEDLGDTIRCEKVFCLDTISDSSKIEVLLLKSALLAIINDGIFERIK